MNTVYIITDQQKTDPDSGKLRSAFNFSSARAFGELKVLLGPETRPWPETRGIVRELHEKLREFTHLDYLLLVGNPCLIGMAVAIAASYSGGQVNLLQWHGLNRSYIPVKVDLREPE